MTLTDEQDQHGAGEGAPAEAAGVATEASALPWYIVHTYSGFENKVREALRNRAQAFHLEKCFGEILVPTESVIEMRNGKKVITNKKFFPGYILVQMDMNDDAWHLVRNTPKVTGFLGGQGKKPQPLPQDEVDRILNRMVQTQEKPKPKYHFDKGEVVRITDGPFVSFEGIVEDVNPDKSTLRVMVTIFGRPTPVELNFLQVEKK